MDEAVEEPGQGEEGVEPPRQRADAARVLERDDLLIPELYLHHPVLRLFLFVNSTILSIVIIFV